MALCRTNTAEKDCLLISQLGALLAWLILSFAWFVDQYSEQSTPWPLILLIASRVLDGLTGGNSSVANAYLSDIVPADKKVKYFGYLGAIMGAGMIVGPAIGAKTPPSE